MSQAQGSRNEDDTLDLEGLSVLAVGKQICALWEDAKKDVEGGA